MFANALLLALDPVFVRRIAEGLELNADRIELIEQRRVTDPTLRHIALALRAGIQSGAAADRMYGEALSTALATRLFKESTGQSPHQYVVDARVRKARELLTTGKFTISEAAHHVGFVDQSHLTRHFKRVFGLPPKRLLSRRIPVV